MKNVKETQSLDPRVNTVRRKASHRMGVDACTCLPVNSVSHLITIRFSAHVSTRGWRDSWPLILIRGFFLITRKFIFLPFEV